MKRRILTPRGCPALPKAASLGWENTAEAPPEQLFPDFHFRHPHVPPMLPCHGLTPAFLPSLHPSPLLYPLNYGMKKQSSISKLNA